MCKRLCDTQFVRRTDSNSLDTLFIWLLLLLLRYMGHVSIQCTGTPNCCPIICSKTGQVPANMKISKIIPIYKSKEKNMGNYRPISFNATINLYFFLKPVIKVYMAFVKLSIFFMITNTDFGQNIQIDRYIYSIFTNCTST